MIPATITYRLVPVSVGNLFALAAQYMNDATRWNEIAAVNGLLDPWFTTAAMLKVPDASGQGNGGILGL